MRAWKPEWQSGPDCGTLAGSLQRIVIETAPNARQDPLAERFFRRGLDIIIALLVLTLTLPLLLFYGISVRFLSEGPATLVTQRIGRFGRPFGLFKMRTMCIDAEKRLAHWLDANPAAKQEWENCYKIKQDPRIVPYVGTFARRSSLDELPQMLNVLRGDMTLVGPRPFPPYHLQAFPIHFQKRRASVLPGVTGLWQVRRKNNSLHEQRRLDEYYLRHRSLGFDLLILARTIIAIIEGKGAC